MTIELKTYTVEDLNALTADLLKQGHQSLPVCATDCRARYPFEAYTVLNQSGYTDALLLYVRPDAHFADRDPLPLSWGVDRVKGWNREADTIKGRCGAFGDRHLDRGPSFAGMKAALEEIWNSTQPGEGHSDSDASDRLVKIAGQALGRL